MSVGVVSPKPYSWRKNSRGDTCSMVTTIKTTMVGYADDDDDVTTMPKMTMIMMLLMLMIRTVVIKN